MATKIRGITIELGANTSKLEKALKDVNGEINSTQKQLRDVEKLLKLDPHNTELLAQKQQLLNDKVAQTSEKLELVKEAQRKFVEEGGDLNSAEYQALTREVISCEDYLKKATEQAEEFAKSSSNVAQKWEKVSESAQKVADKTKGLSTASAGVVAGLTALAIKTGQSADELNTLAKQTGITTDTLQRMQYSADLLDVSVSDVTGAVRKLKGNLDGQADTWAEIGVNVKDASGEYRNIEDIFWDTVSALGTIENEAKRDELAMNLFGKSADQLAGYLDDGGEKARELFATFDDTILSQETLDGLNAVNDTIDEMKARFSGVLAQTGAKTLEAITPAIDMIASALEKVLSVISKLSPIQIQVFTLLAGAVALISPIAGIIAKVSNAVILLNTVLGEGGLMGLISGVGSKLAFLVSNPIGLLIVAIVGLVTLIATKGDEIRAILQKVDDFLQNIFALDFTEVFGTVLGGVLNNFFAYFGLVWDNIKTILDGVISFVQNVFAGNWSGAWESIKGIFTGVFSNIYNFATSKLQGIIDFINKIIDLAKKGVEKINEMTSASNDAKGSRHGNNNTRTAWDAITNPSMPMFANGGSLVGRGQAIVGEAGAELLTLANGRATVTPLTVNMNNQFGEYNHATGGAIARDLVRQINYELGKIL